MKKGILLILIIALAACVLAGCSEPEPEVPDFRNASWGMSQSKVTKSEEGEYAFATDDIIFYETKAEGSDDDVEVTYEFTDGKLTSAEMYFVFREEVTIDQAIEKYLAYREFLTEKYGAPVDDDYRVWIAMDEDTKEDADRLQLYYGRMVYRTVWNTANGSSELSLSCNGYVVTYKLTGEIAPAAE